MPGILGFIKKKKGGQPGDQFLESMLKPLRHLSSYHEEKILGEDYGFASISVDTQQRIFERNSGGREYVVLIDGYIYSVNGRSVSNLDGSSEFLLDSILAAVQNQEPIDFTSLEGNYTIGVFDKTEQKLTLFNDIIGPRRVYFSDLNDCFVFSPEVKAISALPNFTGKLNWKGLADFLNYGYILGDDTFFSDIWSLPSASVITQKRDIEASTLQKYWRPFYEPADISFGDAVETTYLLLCNSIKEKIISGSSVINPISGGLDSRIILGVLTQAAPNLSIKAYTHGQKFSNEYKYAKKVCQTLGIKDHHFTEVLPRYLSNKYQQAVWMSEGMVPLTNALLLLHPEQIGGAASTIFTGIYGGPTNYAAEYYAERHFEQTYQGKEKIHDIKKIISLKEHAYSNIVQPQVLEKLRSASFDSIEKEFSKHEEVSDHFCNQRDAFFIENRMRRMICQTDLFRFFWIEHLPLSNHQLYKYYLTVPPEYKLGKKILKQMLKDNFQELSQIKDANTGLNLFESPSRAYEIKKAASHRMRWYLNRISKGYIQIYDKSTYSHFEKWFQKDDAMFQLWRDALLGEKMSDLGLIDPKQALDKMEQTRKTGLGFNQWARLTTLAIWSEQFLN